MKSLLLPILTPDQCSGCKFCCSFAEFESWETPLFFSSEIKSLRQKFGDFPVKKVGSSYTLDFSDFYETHGKKAYAPCPFLNSMTGCQLNDDEKPFDCKIWPLRIMRVQTAKVCNNKVCGQNLGTDLLAAKSMGTDDNAVNTRGSCQNMGTVLGTDSSKIVLALTPTCPEINKIKLAKIKSFVKESGLVEMIWEKAALMSEMIKEYRDGFPVLWEY